MPNVIVTRQSGEQMTISAPVGNSLMIALRDRDGSETVVGEDFGLCGGCCTCYTCQVWVDEGFLARLTPASEQENDLLGLAEHRQGNSRLSCQIRLTDELEGLRVTLPPAA